MSRIGLLKTPIISRLHPPFRKKSDLFVFGARLLPAPKNIKKQSLQKPIEILKNHTLAPHFDDLGALFGPPFPTNFPDHLNLLNRNTYNAKNSFLPSQASHLGIQNQ